MKMMNAAVVAWLICGPAFARGDSLTLRVGTARQLGAAGPGWKSSAPDIAEVYQNGFVAGLKPGHSRITRNETAECLVTVEEDRQLILDPKTLKQYEDDREFTIGLRKCFGSELNGQRASDPAEKQFTRANRVINSKPLRADKPLDWELQPGTEVYDGAGVLMGTVPATLEVDGRRMPVSMFNFGASKVLSGRICVYAFSVSIVPPAAVVKLMDPADLRGGAVAVSAWLPLDSVVDKEMLLERIGLGKAKAPALPLESKGWRISGGNPKMYMTQFGELSIVRQVGTGPVPSHYLRRPGGTVNLIYSVPGFGLGGQGTDSFLASDGLEFYPATGAKVFHQPTYFPPGHPQKGKPSPQTMTFLYGAVKVSGSEPVYGWIAREALAGAPE
ncbi:MAG TPA: hypothetical protein VGO59_18435 [Verrucomicrobiae bacterium]|jgi:hypothetical protein